MEGGEGKGLSDATSSTVGKTHIRSTGVHQAGISCMACMLLIVTSGMRREW